MCANRRFLGWRRKPFLLKAFGWLDGSIVRARFGSAVNMDTKLGTRDRLSLESLESRQLLAANPIITEFMADNDDNVALGDIERDFGKPDPFGDGSAPDWIEIYNAGDEPLDLQGFHLTDDADDLPRWTFPSVILGPDAYLLVFASGMDGTDFFDG